jgi:hypothetical protein
MPAADALQILDGMADDGKLERALVAALGRCMAA